MVRELKNARSITLIDVKDVYNAMSVDQFSTTINQDLARIYGLMNRRVPTGIFFKHFDTLDRDETDVYIFQHPEPASTSSNHQFSSIHLSDVIANSVMVVDEDQTPVNPTPSNHEFHYAFEMYRRSSVMAEAYYQSVLASAPDSDKSTILNLITLNNNPDFPKYSADYILH